MKTVQKSFRNIHGKELRVEVNNFSEATVSIAVTNVESFRERKRLLMITFCTGGLYLALVLADRVVGSVFGHIFMLLLTVVPVYLELGVVESETVTFVKHFGLHKITEYSRKRVENRLIPTHSIHDIIINEVIQRQRVIFMLQILLQPETTVNERLLSIFEKTQPNLQCLEFIYKLLHRRWDKS
ncbi:uncharacterized protein LOC129809945 [Phlebotomus papatasi]|uniref:uncharacterized protein LOC129809945 n=1 Tax=Phlebotomus papatasi TaxID=29031 RepID=UPI0024838D01|nr:uncharacterized protein LOC129809945 [Phlebotomus papatasi]